MNRGNIRQIDLRGRSGRRPALIFTRQGVNRHVNKLTVAEITSQAKGYPTEVALGQMANLPRSSYVELDNIQTVSKERFVKYVGTVDGETMRQVGRRVILALGLEDCCIDPATAQVHS